MKYWHMQLHPDDLSLDVNDALKILKEGYIGIDIVDYTNRYSESFTHWTKKDINDYSNEVANHNNNDKSNWGKTILNFRDIINVSDIVLVRKGQTPIALVEVLGDYKFDEKTSDIIWFRHKRKIRLLMTYSEYMKASPEHSFSTQAMGTLTKVNLQNLKAETNIGISNWYKFILESSGDKPKVADDIESYTSEGKSVLSKHIRYERNNSFIRKIKEKALLDNKMLNCQVCGFSFYANYGEIGQGFIEAHHLAPLNENGGEAVLTKREDIALVCSNCHRMLHRGNPTFSIEELSSLLHEDI